MVPYVHFVHSINGPNGNRVIIVGSQLFRASRGVYRPLSALNIDTPSGGCRQAERLHRRCTSPALSDPVCRTLFGPCSLGASRPAPVYIMHHDQTNQHGSLWRGYISSLLGHSEVCSCCRKCDVGELGNNWNNLNIAVGEKSWRQLAMDEMCARLVRMLIYITELLALALALAWSSLPADSRKFVATLGAHLPVSVRLAPQRSCIMFRLISTAVCAQGTFLGHVRAAENAMQMSSVRAQQLEQFEIGSCRRGVMAVAANG